MPIALVIVARSASPVMILGFFIFSIPNMAYLLVGVDEGCNCPV